ncbi:hypothetical protein OOU_Y34scaffold00516g4 [Pyricularia oryzae Y34]|uniref:Uncharacterized protein n=1 Tax=Pyricularia oryzae (strain Y34) TaxID=1143189 RepID=A0AA97NZ51_PYRO3|nr:hypothetical protein OOU_Y34scaffold00516g4 [Pyricularia oryzae Y34]
MGERATRKMPGNGPREGVSLALSASTGGQVSNADGAGRFQKGSAVSKLGLSYCPRQKKRQIPGPAHTDADRSSSSSSLQKFLACSGMQP